jgi:hypothetical protein
VKPTFIRLASWLKNVCQDFDGWEVRRLSSGRWLAVRGTICIRAHSRAQLGEQLRQHLADTADDLRDALGHCVRRLENELEADFPGWLITGEASGRWTATLPGWGTFDAPSAPELLDRLSRHARKAVHEQR